MKDVSSCSVMPEAASKPRMAYSMKEAAEILGISYISVWRLVKRRKLRAVDALRTKIIPLQEIQRFLSQAA